MALAVTTTGPKVVECIGQFAPLAFGIATASSTDLTITIPQFSLVYCALVLSTTTATPGYVATTTGNSFSATVGTGEVCTYIAFGKLRA